jgi:hypothetical protein
MNIPNPGYMQGGGGSVLLPCAKPCLKQASYPFEAQVPVLGTLMPVPIGISIPFCSKHRQS